MKKWYGGVFATSLLMLLVLGYYVMKEPIKEANITSPSFYNTTGTDPLKWIGPGAPPVVHNSGNNSDIISAEVLLAGLFDQKNLLSNDEKKSLHTWNHLQDLISHVQVLPNALEAVKEAGAAWKNLLTYIEDEKLHMNESSQKRGKEKQCPHHLSKMNATELDDNGFKLQVPCGLTQGSSITFIGIPSGLLGNFRIDLTGEPLPGEPDPPIILHYNIRLHGDKITEDPVIVQNTWTIAHDWGEEERCPSPIPEKNKKGK